MSKKDQSNEKDLQNKEESLNGSDVENDTDQELESSHQDDNTEEIGTPTYEELFDKKEELEGSPRPVFHWKRTAFGHFVKVVSFWI